MSELGGRIWLGDRMSLTDVRMVIAGLLLAIAMVLGGGAKGGGDAVVHAVAAVALALAVFYWRHFAFRSAERLLLAVLVAAIGVALLQLVPLPVEVFSRLPGRAAVLVDLQSAGLDPQWLPMTLDVWGTLRATLALVSFLAMWLLCASLPLEARINLLKFAVLVAVPLALLGFAQASVKRDTTGATAWFANRNHFAAIMAMLIPFAFAAGQRGDWRRRFGAKVAWHAASVGMLLAAALSFSRLGFLLACFSAVAAAVFLRPRVGGFKGNPGTWLSVAIAGTAVGYFASGRLIARFRSDLVSDLRWQYFETGWAALQAYLPWGSGLGSFRTVYAPFEPMQALGEFTYANYAHNEWIQNGIEGGLPALLLMGAFVVVVLLAAVKAFARRSAEGSWPRAACIAAAVPFIHSLFDYPLRTLACTVLLALVLSVLLGSGAGRDRIEPG